MTYPSAYKGVKKLFTAQMLQLIGLIILAVIAVMILVPLFSEIRNYPYSELDINAILNSILYSTGPALLILAVIAIVLFLVGYIASLIGLGQAGKDSGKIKAAFIIALLSLIAVIVVSIIQTRDNGSFTIHIPISGAASGLDSITSAITSISSLIIILLVISGIRDLAKRLNAAWLASKGKGLMICIAVLLIISIVSGFVRPYSSMVSNVLSIVSPILLIISYIVYLTYLSNAKKVLAEY